MNGHAYICGICREIIRSPTTLAAAVFSRSVEDLRILQPAAAGRNLLFRMV